MKKFRIMIMLLVSALFMYLAGCSSDNNSDSQMTDDSASSDTMTLAEQDQALEDLMNEAMDRLRYKDKSFLYENEFRYYRDKFTYDDYLKERAIVAASSDTLETINVTSVTYFGKDSAKVNADIIFRGPSGKETVKKEKGMSLYWHEGKWIKPSVSNIVAQKEYEDLIDKAKAASQKEKQGSGN